MKDTWFKYLDANVPRYTSYPSALAFTDEIGPAQYAAALGRLPAYEPVSLYLHIPYCRQLCWYCGCNMRVENRPERMAKYVDDLIAEISLVGTTMRGHGRVTQLHFGGGTPNALPGREIERLIDAVENVFGLTDSTPIAMEIDPRLCGDYQAAQLAKLGVTRFSIGVQDFDPAVQKAINREQSFDVVAECVADLRGAGVKDISLDLLYGLPHQSADGFDKTIEQTLELQPDRISLFGYAHMPSRFAHQRLIEEGALPSRGLRSDLSERAAVQLMAAGFDRIGFDHFAKPYTSIAKAARAHALNRNFQGFTEDQSRVVIGLGVSAISTIGALSSQNAKDIRAYRDALAAGCFATVRGVEASATELGLGEWLKRLLCDMRGNLSQYSAILGKPNAQLCEAVERLKPFIEDGIVRLEGDEIVIDNEAKALARRVAACLDPHVKDDKAFASPTV